MVVVVVVVVVQGVVDEVTAVVMVRACFIVFIV